MKWAKCNKCGAEYPIEDDERPKEWVDRCELCGGLDWSEYGALFWMEDRGA